MASEDAPDLEGKAPGATADKVVLGQALKARISDVVDKVAGRTEASGMKANAQLRQVESDIERAKATAVEFMANWLITGELPPTGDPEGLSRVSGRAAARRLISLSTATKTAFVWRDAVVDVISEEGRRLEVSQAVVDETVELVRHGCDANVVRLTQHYDDMRRVLEGTLEESKAELVHQALHDPLTGLANRSFFMECLAGALDQRSAHQGEVGVLFLDLDRFKVINDTYGHPIGDQVLVATAHRIKGLVRPRDTIARFGGDEFVIMCAEMARGEAAAVAAAERIGVGLSQPLAVGSNEVWVSVSIGIAVASDPGEEAEELVSKADSAMYEAKARGRARYEVFHAA
ncbi:MAG: diguanylate cyclase [Acidimicrobiales bacterium]